MVSILWKWHLRTPGYSARQALLEWSALHLPMPQWPLALERSMLSVARLRNLERCAARVAGVPGCFMECGVAEGGSALLLGRLAEQSDRVLWLFDTFEGLPPPSANDPDLAEASEWVGRCRGELPDIQRLLDRHGVWKRTTAVKGLFQDTLPGLAVPPIALLHLDGDWYDSTMTCLTHLWRHVSPGGIVQFDDYGRWQGCRKAVDEFFQGQLPIHPIDAEGIWLQKPVT
jgi:hypothetical protein